MSQTRLLSFALLAMLSGAACVYAPNDPFEGLEPGDVAGRVVVLVPGGEEAARGARVRLLGGTLVRTADGDGRFLLRNVAEGDFVLELTLAADGSGVAEKAARVPLKMTKRNGERARVNLGRIVLSELGGITGTVQAPAGVDTSGTVVMVQGIAEAVPVAADGTFALGRLPGVGTYKVFAHREARPELGLRELISRPVDPIVVTGGKVETIAPLVLQEVTGDAVTGTLQGRLLFPDGDNVGTVRQGVRTQGLALAAVVYLTPSPTGWTGSPQVDEEGFLFLRDLPVGVYDILIEFEPADVAPLYVPNVVVFPNESNDFGDLLMQVLPPECERSGTDCSVDVPDAGAPSGSSSAAPSSTGGSSGPLPSSSSSASSSSGGSSSASTVVVASSAQGSSSSVGAPSSDVGSSSSAAPSSSREPCAEEGADATGNIARLARYCAAGDGVSFELTHTQRVRGGDERLVAMGKGGDALLGGACARVPDGFNQLLIRYSAAGACEQFADVGVQDPVEFVAQPGAAGAPGRVLAVTGNTRDGYVLHQWNLETLAPVGLPTPVLGTNMLTATPLQVTQLLPLSNGGVAFLLSSQMSGNLPVRDGMGVQLTPEGSYEGKVGIVAVLDSALGLSWLSVLHHNTVYGILNVELLKLEEPSSNLLRLTGTYEGSVAITTTTAGAPTLNTTMRPTQEVGLFTATFSVDGLTQETSDVPIFASGSSSGALPAQGLYRLVDARNAHAAGTVVGRLGQQETGTTQLVHYAGKGSQRVDARTYGTTVVSHTEADPGSGFQSALPVAVLERDPRAPAGRGAPDLDADPSAHVLPSGDVLFFKNMAGVRRPLRVGPGNNTVNHVVASPGSYSETDGHDPAASRHLFVVGGTGTVTLGHVLRPLATELSGGELDLKGVFPRTDGTVDLWFQSQGAWEMFRRTCSGTAEAGTARVVPRGDSLVNISVTPVLSCTDLPQGTDVLGTARTLQDRGTEFTNPPTPEQVTLPGVGSRFVQAISTPDRNLRVTVRVSQVDGNSDACHLVDVELVPQPDCGITEDTPGPPARRFCVERQFNLAPNCQYELHVRGYSDVPLPPLNVLATTAPIPDNTTCALARPVTLYGFRSVRGSLEQATPATVDETACGPGRPTGAVATVFYEITPLQTGFAHLTVDRPEVTLTEVDATCGAALRCPYKAGSSIKGLLRPVTANVPFRVAVSGMAEPFELTALLFANPGTVTPAATCGAAASLFEAGQSGSGMVTGVLPDGSGAFTPNPAGDTCGMVDAPGQDGAYLVTVLPFKVVLLVLRLDPTALPARTPVLYAMSSQACTQSVDGCDYAAPSNGTDTVPLLLYNNFNKGPESYVVVLDSNAGQGPLPYQLYYQESFLD